MRAKNVTTELKLGSVVVLLTVLLLSLVLASSALAAASVTVQGASALDSTHVKVSFNRAVNAGAANASRYVVAPGLAVTGVTLADGNNSAILSTVAQSNATAYTVTVSGIAGMRSSQRATFVGTSLPVSSTTTFEDDFNRPSGLLLGDSPISGPWTIRALTSGNVVSIRSAPATTPSVPWAGSGSLYSQDTPLTADADNASVKAKIAGVDFFYSAYLYLPKQTWPAGTEVGLLRLNTSVDTAHARVFALTQSSSAYTLQVNWKNLTGAYNTVPSTVATGVTFGQWHWLQMHVRNGVSGDGEVQVFVDGKLSFQDRTTGVYPVKMIYAEAGIMHMSTGATATTYTDQARVATSFTLPSVKNDTTAPSILGFSTSATQIQDPASFTLSARDAVGVQRVDFLLDGNTVATSDFAPDYSWTGGAATGTYQASFVPTQSSGIPDGAHQLTAKVYDTSGNATSTGTVTVTTDSSGPGLLSPAVSPNPFTPNGDGSQDTTKITSATADTVATYTVQIFKGSALVKTLKSLTNVAAGTQSTSWDGTYYDAATHTNQPVADGTYTARITVGDSYGRTTSADLAVTVDRTLKRYSLSRTLFSPTGSSSSVTGSYYLLAGADVTVTVEQNNVVLRTIQASTSQTGDTAAPVLYKFVWDGRDDLGAVVPDGAYTVRVAASNSIGVVSLAKSVTVDTTAPSVAIDSIAPFPSWAPATDGPLAVTYLVSEAGSGTVKFTLGGTTQRTIAIAPAAPGQQAITWDGTRNDLVTTAPAGDYKVKVAVTDLAGNTTNVTYPGTGYLTIVWPAL